MLRRGATGAVALVAVACCAAAAAHGAVGPAVGAGGAAAAREASAYRERFRVACAPWGRKLAQVPAPASVGSPVVLATLAGRVLPLLEGQAKAVGAVPAPAALRDGASRLLAENRAAIEAVRLMGAAARKGDIAEAQRQLAAFLTAQEVARTRADVLGLRCTG